MALSYQIFIALSLLGISFIRYCDSLDSDKKELSDQIHRSVIHPEQETLVPNHSKSFKKVIEEKQSPQSLKNKSTAKEIKDNIQNNDWYAFIKTFSNQISNQNVTFPSGDEKIMNYFQTWQKYFCS